jgi:hypothetical protein
MIDPPSDGTPESSGNTPKINSTNIYRCVNVCVFHYNIQDAGATSEESGVAPELFTTKE